MSELTRGIVSRDTGRLDFQRGQRYFKDGRVTSVHAEFLGDDLLLQGVVRGGQTYRQSITVSRRGAGRLRGHCSCPVGDNCKHVVAVSLAHIQDRQAPSTGTDPEALMRWVTQLQASTQDPPQGTGPIGRGPFVAYVLSAAPAPNAQRGISLDVEIRQVRRRAGGTGFTKGTKLSTDRFRYDFHLSEVISPIDESIVALLGAGRLFVPDFQIQGPAGALALDQIMATGHAFWTSTDAMLALGPTRPARVEWQQDRDGSYTLQPRIEPAAQILATEPPWYLDSNSREVGPLDIGEISPTQWSVLLRAPTLPRELARATSLQLKTQWRDLPVPEPVQVEERKISNTAPVPRLRLIGVDMEEQGHLATLYALELSYCYADCEIQPRPQEPRQQVVDRDSLVQVDRDLPAEQEAIEALTDLGFECLEDDDLPGPHPFVVAAAHISQSLDVWRQFVEVELPRLAAAGWDIIEEPSFDMRFEQAQLDGELESDNDWFALRFDLEVDGEKLPLAPLIAPWIDSLLELPDDQWPTQLSLPAGDGRFLSIPADSVRPTLQILRELYDPQELADNDLQRSRFEAAPLAALDEARIRAGNRRLMQMARKLRDFSGIESVAPPVGLRAQLRGYQQQGLDWLQFLREYDFAGILADDMGLGKTLQTLAHLLLEKEQGRLDHPALVIAPTSLMANWRHEAQRFTPDLRVLVLQGAERHRHSGRIDQADIVLSTYPLLSRDAKTLQPQDWSWVILDEAQNVKNPKTKAAKLIRELKARHRLCLTGTPMENHLGELWAQFDFLMPGFLWDPGNFSQRYRKPIEQQADLQARAELSRRIAPFMLRRTKDQVATELPAKTEIVRAASFAAPQAQLYESIRIAMDKKVREAIAKQGLARSHITILDALLKLRQTCCDPRLLKLEQAARVTTSAKLQMLMELLPELLEEGRKVLLFSQFTQMLSLIEKELRPRGINYAKLTGQTKNREAAINSFRQGEVDLFLISLKAGGVGLNLPEADCVILYDPWWNPAVEAQAADRAHRIGQDKPVFVYKLLIENSVEETIVGMQAKKRALADAIYSGKAKTGEALFDPDSLKALFAPLADG